jgi:Spy/CpxP family protein refolding chaperone
MKILLLFVAGAGFLAAQQGTQPGVPARRNFGPGPGGPERNLEQRLTQRLSLTAEQQNKVHTILAERDVIAKGSREQAQALNTSLTAAVKAGNEDQIDRISQDIANLHQKQVALHGKSMAKIYAALSPAQQAKVGPNLEMLMGRGFPGPGQRPGPGGPPKGAAPAAQ